MCSFLLFLMHACTHACICIQTCCIYHVQAMPPLPKRTCTPLWMPFWQHQRENKVGQTERLTDTSRLTEKRADAWIYSHHCLAYACGTHQACSEMSVPLTETAKCFSSRLWLNMLFETLTSILLPCRRGRVTTVAVEPFLQPGVDQHWPATLLWQCKPSPTQCPLGLRPWLDCRLYIMHRWGI